MFYTDVLGFGKAILNVKQHSFTRPSQVPLLKVICMGLLTVLVLTARVSAQTKSDVEFTYIEQSNFHGNLYVPEKTINRSVIIVLGGSSGGMRTHKGEYLAQNGFVALTLAYFRHDSLPSSLDNIPVESVSNAIDFIQNDPKFANAKFGLWAASRGTELAFLAASIDPRISSIVATSPSNVSWHGARTDTAWTIQSKGVYSLTFEKRSNVALFERASTALGYKEQVTSAQFKFEDMKADLLLISAKQDNIWPSTKMSQDIMNYLEQHEYAYSSQHIALDAKHVFRSKTLEHVFALTLSHFNSTLK